MNIVSAPQNGQGAGGDLIYILDGADPSQTIDVWIANVDGSIVAAKSFNGQSQYEVNIAPYMRRFLDVAPCVPHTRLYSLPDSYAKGMLMTSDGTFTEVLIFTAGTLSKPIGEPLTDAPLRHRIAPGEPDGIYYVLETGDSIELELLVDGESYEYFEGDAPYDGIHSPNIVAPEFGTSMILRSIKGNATETVREYTIVRRGSRAMRLCWLNPYGALDFYTFERTDGMEIVAAKSRAYTSRGHEVYDSTAETLTGLRSDYEDAETLRWLAQVINSPRVWVCEEGGFRRVDVVTGRVAIPDTAPARLEFTIRDVKKTIFR